jgi:hypothetical protein
VPNNFGVIFAVVSGLNSALGASTRRRSRWHGRLFDEINGARPGLIAVCLCHAHVNRQVPAAGSGAVPMISANLGIELASKAAPDGHTILIVPETIISNPHVYKVNYDPLKDFVPVVQISRQPVVLAAHPELDPKTIADLVTLAKRQPGMRFATGSGVGSQQHMVTMWFAKIAGIQLDRCRTGAAAKRSTI